MLYVHDNTLNYEKLGVSPIANYNGIIESDRIIKVLEVFLEKDPNLISMADDNNETPLQTAEKFPEDLEENYSKVYLFLTGKTQAMMNSQEHER